MQRMQCQFVLRLMMAMGYASIHEGLPGREWLLGLSVTFGAPPILWTSEYTLRGLTRERVAKHSNGVFPPPLSQRVSPGFPRGDPTTLPSSGAEISEDGQVLRV
jgi:hypothetical protein